jgi:hypothetical protein
MNKLFYILTVVPFLFLFTAKAQQEVFKVSKPVTYNFTNEVKYIEITAEKATVSTEGWEKNHIEVQVTVISRNANKKIAEADLKVIKTTVNQIGSNLFLKNYFEGKNTTIGSNLSVEYHLKVPSNIALKITNLFGRVYINNHAGLLMVNVSYGTAELIEISGTTKLTSHYCSVSGNKITGKFNCNAEKSDISLNAMQALVNMESKYGEIMLSLSPNPQNVTINSQRSKVTVNVPNSAFNYKLKTIHSEIYLPGQLKSFGDFYENSNNKNASLINISTSYCPITIIQQP